MESGSERETSESEIEDNMQETNTFENNIELTNNATEENVELPHRTIQDTWTETSEGMKQIPFTKVNQLLVDSPGQEPYDWFRLLVDDELLNMIVLQSNNYAVEVLSVSSGHRSRISAWKPLTISELLVFIGLTLHTGTIKLPRICDYWKKHRLFSNCFSTFMSRDRYFLIMRCLHFCENLPATELPPADRLYKVRPIMNHFNSKMQTVYYPGKHLSLDESMVLWKGKLSFRQYLPKKKHKYGVKLYMLTESDGTVLDLTIYAGANDSLSGKNHTEKVVMFLMRNFLNSGHSLYMDNYYNSCNLAKELLNKNTFCTGTIRKDRIGNPPEVTKANLKKGESKGMYSEKILVGKWRDKRDVLYISTEFENIMENTKNRRGNEVEKPLPVVNYNKYMGGIDHRDQMSAYYPMIRKTLRWYKKIGIHMFQLYLQNAHSLFNKYSGRKLSLYQFRLEILEKLLPDELQQIEAHRNLEHLPTKIEIRNENHRILRKKCRMCGKNKIRKDTPYHCPTCPDKPGLCLGACFRKYHER